MVTFVQELSLEVQSGAVAKARRFTAEVLAEIDGQVLRDAELVVTELVTNALLHGLPPVQVRVLPGAGRVRVEVLDRGPRPPVRIPAAGESMTGRGLALVAALSTGWGVMQQDEGKLVWAELPVDGRSPGAPGIDLTAVLRDWVPDAEPVPLFTIELGDVPTDLLLEAKAHVDNVARELRMAASEQLGAVPAWLGSLLASVTTDFAGARTQIKEQALAAAQRGAPLTHLTLRLPADAAAAGERYLAALDEADEYARAAQLLTLESPELHRVFRRWYVGALAAQLRDQVDGKPARPPETFAERRAADLP